MIRLIAQSIIELFLKLFDFLSNKRINKLGEKKLTHALDATQLAAQDNPLSRLTRQHPGKSGFYLLGNNIDAFLARCHLIEQAHHTLDLQYYSFHGDTSGKLIAQALVNAADRGVRVRLLLDDIDTLGVDEGISLLNAHPDIEIRIFNPFVFRGLLRYFEFIVDLARVGRRMHNKALIADNAQAIVGGRNISDIYFSADPDVLFLDIDLLTIGEIVSNVSNSFDEYWNSDWAVPVDCLYARPSRAYALKRIKRVLKKFEQQIGQIDYLQTLQSSPFKYDELQPENLSFVWADAELVYDMPDKITRQLDEQKTAGRAEKYASLHELLALAESHLTIISPYFVPGDQGMRWIKSLIAKGVKIHVYTNSLAATDVVAVHAGYRQYRMALLELGVRLYELKPSAYARERRHFKILKPGSRTSLHAKTYVLDHSKVFIGSANLDPRSSELNTEMGLLINNEQIADQFLHMFATMSSGDNSYQLLLDDAPAPHTGIVWRCQQEGVAYYYTEEPQAGLWRRFKAYFYGLLPIESLL